MVSNTMRRHHFSSIIFITIFLVLGSLHQANSRTMHDEIMQRKHEKWITHHKRVYKSNLEKHKRFKIFKANMEFIDNFNKAANRTYTLGANKFTDYTSEEFLATHTGYVRNSMEKSPSTTAAKSFRYQNMQDLPDYIDWRELDYIDWRELGAVTDVKDQYNLCGSCWAFSSVAALEGLYQITTGNLVSLSEQELVDCMSPNSCQGNRLSNAYNFVRLQGGLTSESAYPYVGYQDRYCGYNANSPRFGAIEGYENVPQNDEFAIQCAVAHQPVTIAIDPVILHHYHDGIVSGECSQDLSHAVAIVGYGTSDDGMKYWTCKNSWGSDWGEDGFFRIQRDSGVEGGMCGIAINPTFPVA